MVKSCKNCNISLDKDNAARKNAKYFRNECKPCRSKFVSKSHVGNKARQQYMRNYIRKIGLVKEYPCETCEALCYKKYAKAFCSEKCRFMSYIKISNGCWIWTGTKNRSGYGKFCYKGKNTDPAHRVSYDIFIGKIPRNKLICHSCDNPSCVSPNHLWVGTSLDNYLDMKNKIRHPRMKIDYLHFISPEQIKQSGLGTPFGNDYNGF